MKSDFGTLVIFLMVFGFHGNVTGYWMVLGIQAAFGYYHQYQERKQTGAASWSCRRPSSRSQLVQAQLSALKMQLQPHFLFNTLNAIMVLVRQQRGRQAEEMLARLSDLLRCVLEDVEAQEIPLRRELEYLGSTFPSSRCGFRIACASRSRPTPRSSTPRCPTWACSRSSRTPCAMASAGARRRALEIRAARIGQTLRIQVRDDGPGLPPEAHRRRARGIGLANTRARLRQLYGDAAWLTLENGRDGAWWPR